MCFHTYRVEQSKENTEQANSETMEPSDDKHNGNDETISDVNADSDASQKDFNYFKQAVKICCGSNFTVAIQPGRYKLLIETTNIQMYPQEKAFSGQLRAKKKALLLYQCHKTCA
jgi:hypothetical protein